MALVQSITKRLHKYRNGNQRYLSALSSPDSNAPLTSKQKSLTALSLLKSETNPERIVEICLSASLTPKSHLDRLAFSRAVSSLTKHNNYNALTTLLDTYCRSDSRDVDDSLLNHVLLLYGQAGMPDNAIRVFKGLTQDRRSTKSFNSLLLGLFLGREFKELRRVFTEFPGVYGIKPDVESYNLVVKALCEEGKSDSGYSILAEMDRNGVKPNAATFGRLVEGFYRDRKGDDEIVKVLGSMKEKYGIKENLGIWNVRIKELCKLKRVNEAKGLYDGLVKRKVKVNCETYGNLILGFCKEGRLDEAKGLFKVMVNSGCQATNSIYFTLVYYLCQHGDFESALGFCKESMAKKWVPNFGTMKLLVNGLASNSKVEDAKELIKVMKEKFSTKTELWDEIEAGLPH